MIQLIMSRNGSPVHVPLRFPSSPDNITAAFRQLSQATQTGKTEIVEIKSVIANLPSYLSGLDPDSRTQLAQLNQLSSIIAQMDSRERIIYAKALAVRKVTTNKGKHTPGIDKELWNTPAVKMRNVLILTDKGYKAKPLRRVFIEKPGKKKKRPLGIPCMYDRAMQALYALALDPVSETTADEKSFGFRRGRSAQDACEYIFTALSRRTSPEWVLEGDIKGCFDHISHDWLIEHIPMDKSVLKQFLKAGFVFQNELFPTDEGTPQGGVISPILANMALDGMQKVLSDRFHTNRLGKIDLRFKNAHKVNLVRYADDFIVTAATKEIAEEAKEIIRGFLCTRGLELSEEKTLITHVDDGFDMLGWTFRRFKEKLIVKPSKKSVKALNASLHNTVLERGKAWRQEDLIRVLNRQLRGWANYHQSVCAKDAFSRTDHILYEMLWRWAKRRHPKKNRKWITANYWYSKGLRNWVFSTKNAELIRLGEVPVIRHTKVRMSANPYLDSEYFIQRKFQNGMKRLSGRFKKIWRNQNGCCYHCGQPMEISDEREIFYKIPKSMGGKDDVPNMAYVHKYCQSVFLERRARA